MQCPKCQTEMDAADSFVVEGDYIEVERECSKCGIIYYGILYPVRSNVSLGGG